MSTIIARLEQKLRSDKKRPALDKDFCKLSTNQYWDLLPYIDDDYLTEWEVLKFRQLYRTQLYELAAQAAVTFFVGYLTGHLVMGPIVRSQQGRWLKTPVGISIAFFLSIPCANWMRPSKPFHEIMAQPSPNGKYIRTVVKEHFPVWWTDVSKTLHESGYSNKEMNEYGDRIDMPYTDTRFDNSWY